MTTRALALGFQPALPPWALWALAAFACVALGWVAWRDRALVPARAGGALLLLRLAAAAGLAAMLVDPFHILRRPDRSACRVVVLADASASMLTRDAPGGATRLEAAAAVLGIGDAGRGEAPVDLLRRVCPVEVRAFAARSERLTNAGLNVRPGQTAIGSALEEALASDPGAIAILTDGVSLRGTSPVDAARKCRDAGVPVTVVGIGQANDRGGLAARFERPPDDALSGESLRLDVRVENRDAHARTVAVELLDEEEPIGNREIEIGAGKTASVPFVFEPRHVGLRTFRARARLRSEMPDQGAATPAAAHAVIQVRREGTHRVLLAGAHLHWEPRFIRNALAGDRRFDLTSIVRIVPGRYARVGDGAGDAGSGERDEAGPPADADQWMRYDVVVLHTALVAELAPGSRSGLKAFVLDRGGGVLLVGSLDPLDEILRPLAPTRRTETAVAGRDRALELAPEPIFAEASGGALLRSPPLFLPGELPALFAAGASRGSVVAARVAGSGDPVLLAHAYGAGRVAHLGTAHTWVWAMAGGERGATQHREFWCSLLSWLGAGGKQRLDAVIHGKLVPIDQEAGLRVAVSGADFQPASEARVSASVRDPTGEARETRLTPVTGRPGTFDRRIELRHEGEHRVEYKAELPGGETLARTAFFLAAPVGREGEDVAFRESEMRDVARLTGGRFLGLDEARALRHLPISSKVPFKERSVHWVAAPLFISILLMLLFTEWFGRRRCGLR